MEKTFFIESKTESPDLNRDRRDLSIDVLRCIACFMVCILHTIVLALPDQYAVIMPGTEGSLCATVYQVLLGAPAVLFVMISGVLFLSPDRQVRAGSLWKKNIPKLAGLYIVWSLIYALYRIHMMDPQPVLTGRFLVQQCFVEPEHLWYLRVAIGLYILVPILRLITASEDRKLFAYATAIFIGTLLLNTMYTWQVFPSSETVLPILGKMPLELISQYLFWMIFGWIVYAYRPKRAVRFLIYLLGIAAAAGGIAIGIYSANTTAGSIATEFKFITLCKNVALFLFVISALREHRFTDLGARVLRRLSRCTLMIYLVHGLILRILFDYGAFLDSGVSAWILPVIYAGIAFGAGTVLSLILQFARDGLCGIVHHKNGEGEGRS